MNEIDVTDLENVLKRIRVQADAEDIRITQHAQQEMTKEAIAMKCSISGCPGEYEDRKIVHTVRYQGQVRVIDHVPAEVCSLCGDVLFKPETVRQIETLLRTAGSSV